MTAADLVDTRVAAERIGMSYDWLRKQVKAGLVECHRFGRVVRFSDEQIERIKADHLQPVAPAIPALALLRTSGKPKTSPTYTGEAMSA